MEKKPINDETMHALTAEILGAIAVAATATKTHNGFLGAIYGAIAKFVVAEVKEDKRDEFMRQTNEDLLRMIAHYSTLFTVAQTMAESLKEIVAKTVGEDDADKPVH